MKKTLIAAFAVLMLSITALCAPIYKYEDTINLTDTVTLSRVREFHSDKNVSYSVLCADLSDENISLELLKSADGVDILDTTLNLASTNENTIAAVNGDFFSVYSGKKGFSLGIEYKDGLLLQSPIYPETMATAIYDGESVIMDYFTYELVIEAPNGETDKVRHINKHTDYHGDILMFKDDFNGGFSPAYGGEVVEVVVEDGIITEIRRQMESVAIPENGCVLAVSEGNNMFFANNFEVGDEIVFHENYSVDFDDVKTAFGGGSMLVYEGQDVGKIGDYTHTVAGLNPRTAIGVDETGSKLFLVCVDGRQGESSGMRMSHLAELLISLGCEYAVNLDGGGSTSMVASSYLDENLHIVNKPTENRKVINAVGITLDKENYDSEPCEIILSADKEYAFVGQEVNISCYVVDEKKRPVSVLEYEVELEASDGELSDGVLVCENAGTVEVTAYYDDIEATIYVEFVENVSGIETETTLDLNTGEEYKLNISAFDEKGNLYESLPYDLFEIVSSNPDVAFVKDGTVIAKGNGTAQIFVRRSGAESVIYVSVGQYTYSYYYGFEENAGKFVSYPEDTKGSFEITDEKYFSDKFSGKLSFDFSEEIPEDSENIILDETDKDNEFDELLSERETIITDEAVSVSDEPMQKEDIARGAYFSLEKPVAVADECDVLYLNVLVTDDFNHTLKAQFTDGNGRIATLSLAGTFEKDTWRGFAAYIPEDFVRPLQLTRLYVLYTPGEEKDSGCVYFDDLNFTAGVDYKTSDVFKNKYVTDKTNGGIYNTLTVGTAFSDYDKNPLTVLAEKRIGNILSKKENSILISNKTSSDISDENGFTLFELDTSKGGIRKTDPSQWDKLVESVETSKEDNLFIVSNKSLFGEDEFENKVIIDYLSDCGKNVFVVTPDDVTKYQKIGNVNFISLDKNPENSYDGMFSQTKSAVEFYIGENVTFDFITV